MKQSPDYPRLARLAVIQHLRSYGIKIKHWNSKQRADPGKGSSATPHTGKIFGAPILSLPQLFIPEYGSIPTFLVDVCKYLESHAHTEGLFRKSGSVVRQKLLKAKLDGGDSDLMDALPCDVAGILKQFFRELPEPILPADLQDVLCKAQQLSHDEKTSATILISCLMHERAVSILRYFFNFLQNVSMRSDTNRMNSSNLAVIFAPNLLQTGDSEKISSSTEKKLRVQAAIVQTLIDQASDIGCVPNFLLEKIPGMLGMDVGSNTPGAEPLEEGDADSPGERKRRRRKSVGDFVSGALNKLKTNRTPTCTSTPQTDRIVLSSMVTPFILTPSTKRKLPVDSVQGISNKKRKSIKQNLTFELLPSTLFGGGSTPSSARTEGSPCVSFEISENSFSPSVSGSKHLSSSSNLRRSKRYENRKVQRVESGKTGCFSPKISRKEMVRRSLRLRFSLGKSSKEVNSGYSSSIRSQNIGWRLANSQELPVPENKLEDHCSPVESPFVSAGSKKISKSEENLLTPKKSDDSSHRMSWTGPPPLSEVCDDGTPLSGYLYAVNCYSEPVLVTGKPPAIPKESKSVAANYSKENNHREDSLCVDEECQARNTVCRITQAFIESGSDLGEFGECSNSSAQEPAEFISEPQTESETLVIGSVVDIDQKTCISEPQTESDILIRSNKHCTIENSPKRIYKEQNVEKDLTNFLEAPAEYSETNAHQDSPQILLKIVEDTDAESTGLTQSSHHNQKCDMDVFESSSGNSSIKSVSPAPEKVVGLLKSENNLSIPMPNKENCSRVFQAIPSVPAPVRRTSRVSDHIQHFNRLCLNDSSAQKVKSPIKFQRTPVRQSVRRINSLSGVKRDVDNLRGTERIASSPMVKSVSYDGSLSSELSVTRSSYRLFSAGSRENSTSCEHLTTVSFQGVSSRFSKQTFENAPTSVLSSVNPVKSVLEDLTNQDITRSTCAKSDLSINGPKNALRILSNREHNRYRGSPKNPIGKVAFLPASKPLDL